MVKDARFSVHIVARTIFNSHSSLVISQLVDRWLIDPGMVDYHPITTKIILRRSILPDP